jgi:hypothetical protein
VEASAGMTDRAMPTKEVVLVCLGRKPQTGEPDLGAPFMVKAQDPHRSGLYYDEPAVIEQILPGEREARFEPEWNGAQWRCGKRISHNDVNAAL